MMTISAKLTPKRAKKVAANMVVLVDKIKVFSDMKSEAADKDGDELNEAGYGILQKFFDFAFEEEYELILTIISDLFGISFEEAEELPIEDIYDFVIKDKVIRTFFPRLAVLERSALSDISLNQTDFPSPPTPSTSKAGQKTTLIESNSKAKK